MTDLDAAVASIRRWGGNADHPALDLHCGFGGLDIDGLRIGLGQPTGRSPPGPTIPVARAPNDAVYWMGTDSTVYDDTDYERIVPVAHGGAGLVRYWRDVLQGSRWNGQVHAVLCTLLDLDLATAARRSGLPVGGFAVGTEPALWSAAAAAVSDHHEGRPTATIPSVRVSAPSLASLGALWIRLGSPPRIRLDQPAVHALPWAPARSVPRIQLEGPRGAQSAATVVQIGGTWTLAHVRR